MESHSHSHDDEPVMGYPVPGTLFVTESDDNQTFPKRCIQICCKMINALVIIILFVIVIALFSMLFKVHLPSFEAKSTVSMLNLTESHLSARWEVYLYVQNPNRVASIDYQNVVVKIMYNKFHLANTTIDPFHQHKSSNKMVQANMTSSSVTIDKGVAAEIVRTKEDGFVGVSLLVKANMTISLKDVGLGGIKWRNPIRVLCQEAYAVVIGKGMAGKYPYEAMDCSVEFDGV